MADGESPTFQGGVNGFDLEDDEDEDMEVEMKRAKIISKRATTSKVFKKAKAKAPFYPFKRKEQSRRAITQTGKVVFIRKATDKRATAKAPKPPKAPKTPEAPNSSKTPKPPNWRLKENSRVAVAKLDPYFEARRADQTSPFVSSVVHSKLLFGAVFNSDVPQLKRICEDVKHVHTLEVFIQGEPSGQIIGLVDLITYLDLGSSPSLLATLATYCPSTVVGTSRISVKKNTTV